MTTYIALLRAVNLGGPTQVDLAELRGRVERLGFTEVRSVLQSGNLVFRGRAEPRPTLERRLEAALAEGGGRSTEFFVRTTEEWDRIGAENPFPNEARTDPAHLVVTLLKSAPPAGAWRELDGAIVGRERVRGTGDRAYIVYPDGIGRSKLTAALIERRLGTRGTSRNWNTVERLRAVAHAVAEGSGA